MNGGKGLNSLRFVENKILIKNFKHGFSRNDIFRIEYIFEERTFVLSLNAQCVILFI